MAILHSYVLQVCLHKLQNLYFCFLPFKYADNPGRLDRRALSWALCIPSLCTASDIKMSLEHTLEPLFQNSNLGVSVDVNPALCTVKYHSHPSVGYYQAW